MDGSLIATSCKDKKIRVIDPRFKNVFQQIDKGDYQVAAYPKSGSQNDTISLSLNAFIIDSDAVNTVNFDNIGNSITSILTPFKWNLNYVKNQDKYNSSSKKIYYSIGGSIAN